MNYIQSIAEFNKISQEELGVLFYFSTVTCNVGEALESKVAKMLQEHFPKMPMYFVDTNALTELAAQNSVFVVPTVLVYFDGKETIRKSRNIGVSELGASIERLYNILFE
jgi:thioredoxin-like negative regulator of GroEL